MSPVALCRAVLLCPLILSGLLAVLPVVTAARAAGPGCPAGAEPVRGGPGTLLACRYARTDALLPSHVGGPWVNVDLLHATQHHLDQLRQRQSGTTIYPGSMNGDPPQIPRLGLVHAQICLSDPHVVYSDCPNNYPNNAGNAGLGFELNPRIITRLNVGFDRLRRAGLKVILRFTYNFPTCWTEKDGDHTKVVCNPPEPADAPMNVILDHMRRLAPVVRANRDVIFALQAGFIGRWGEWHNSTSGNDTPAQRNRFLNEYRQLFQGITNLEVRRPEYVLDYHRHLRDRGQKNALLSLGLGMHDDAFGSDLNDGSTFRPEGSTYDTCQLRAAASLLASRYTMTGETSARYEFKEKPDCDDEALKPSNYEEFASTYSLTTLQLEFAAKVWKRWWLEGSYKDILRKIGPHLSLASAELTIGGRRREARLMLTLDNTGWARLANERPVYFVLWRDGREVMRRRVALELTEVLAGGSLSRRLDLGAWRNLPAGRYSAFLAVPDPAARLADNPNYALFFENEGAIRPSTGLNFLGTFELPEVPTPPRNRLSRRRLPVAARFSDAL